MYRNNYATVEESIKRMQNLMGNSTHVVQSVSQPLGNIERVYKGCDGNSYAIIKENSKYYLKTSTKDRDLKLEDFEYLGGNRQCKGLYEYKSYNQAEKVLKEELVTLAENINKKELVVEERQRVDTNLAQTVTTKEMRGEIDRIREIMENTNMIVTKGSTSVQKRAGKPLNEQVKIGDKKEGVLTDGVNEGEVNEVLGLVGGAIGSAARGVGKVASGAVDAVGDVASSVTGAVGDTVSGLTGESSEEDEISLDDEEMFGDEEEIDLDDEFSDEEELDDEFEEGEVETDDHMEEEMDILNALMDKLNSIEQKLDGESGEEEITLDDEEFLGGDEVGECGLSEAFLSDKLNTKYNTLPKQQEEHKVSFENAVISWLRNQEEYLDYHEIAEKLKEKIDQIVAEEEFDDRTSDVDDDFHRMMGSGDDEDMGKRIFDMDSEKNFNESIKRMVDKIVKETINTVASDVTKDKFSYSPVEPDSKGRTSFEDVSADGEIGLGNHHQDTLDKINSTVGKHSGNSSPKNFSSVEIEVVDDNIEEGYVSGYLGAKVAPGMQGARQNKRLDDLEAQMQSMQTQQPQAQTESRSKKLYIVEQDGTVVGQIPKESFKRKK